MNEEKRVRYEAISEKITQLAGGRENIVGLAHCATRLRLVLADNEKADIKAMEEVDLVKGVFVAGDQVQIIFGTGLVNDVCEVMGELNHMNTMSLGDLKTKAGQKMNPLQKALKALSDVFIEIMPGILAAALLTGLSSVLGNLPAVESNETLYGIVRLINISSGAIFGFLPLCVAYSTVKRFGGRPIMGIVIGCIMLSNSLADAYAAAQGTVDVTTLHIFGFNVELVGFQGGIIVALLIGIVIAKLDQFFEKKVPEMIRLLVSPLLTILISSFLLFLLIGPIGRGLASGITAGLVWMTKNLGIVGYVVFSGVQQLIVITGLHHVFGAIETQLLVDTGRNFLNPLMSVAIIAQGGAVLGYMVRNLKNAKAKELLAVLVDQGGREISLHEMAQILSDGEDDETARQAVHVAWSRLKKTLVSYGLGDIVKKGRGFYALNRRRIRCDCWEMLEENEDRYFMGEYMPEYSWAEVTLSYLLQKFEEIKTRKIREA